MSEMTAQATYPRDSESDVSQARIESQVQYLTERIEQLHKHFGELTARIESILLPENDDAMLASVPSPPSLPASFLSTKIDECNGEISRLIRRISYVTDRVQL